jgi:hypothetical protein
LDNSRFLESKWQPQLESIRQEMNNLLNQQWELPREPQKTWDDVVLGYKQSPPTDYRCQNCGDCTFAQAQCKNRDSISYEVDYAKGGWLENRFLCDHCLVNILGEPDLLHGF